MTYKDIVYRIGQTANGLSASFYYGSVLKINERRDIQYPIVVLAPRQNNMTGDNSIDYGFVLWYIDIQDPDRQDALKIQSRGIEVLRAIGNRLYNSDLDVEINQGATSLFWERFADIDAGAMCDLTVTAIVDDCDLDNRDFTPEHETCYYDYFMSTCGALPVVGSRIITENGVVVLSENGWTLIAE